MSQSHLNRQRLSSLRMIQILMRAPAKTTSQSAAFTSQKPWSSTQAKLNTQEMQESTWTNWLTRRSSTLWMKSKTRMDNILILMTPMNTKRQERDSKTESQPSEADRGRRTTKRFLNLKSVNRKKALIKYKWQKMPLKGKTMPWSSKIKNSGHNLDYQIPLLWRR